MVHLFWIESKELWVADGSQVVWRGQPDDIPVESVIAIPGTEDAIAVLDADAGPRNALGDLKDWPNLIRVTATGRVVWRAPPPGTRDWWVGVAWTENGLMAHTWSGLAVVLDPDTGLEISRVFAK